MFVPRLYIGIGAFNHFFTLRESYQHHYVSDGIPMVEVRVAHLFNLSQDADAALEKAREYAGKVGLALQASKETMEQEMLEIKRASERELADRAAREAAQALEAEERRKAYEEKKLADAKNGYIPFGRYKNHSIKDLRDEGADAFSYLIWLANSDIESPIFDALRAKIKELEPRAFLPKPDREKTFGEVGQRIEVKVTVTAHFCFQSDFGVMHIVNMVTEDGSMLVSKGKFNVGSGARLKIKATIKGHSEYKGQMQTVVQRAKVLEAY